MDISKAGQLEGCSLEVRYPSQKHVSAPHWAVGKLWFISHLPLPNAVNLARGLASAEGAESPHPGRSSLAEGDVGGVTPQDVQLEEGVCPLLEVLCHRMSPCPFQHHSRAQVPTPTGHLSAGTNTPSWGSGETYSTKGSSHMIMES